MRLGNAAILDDPGGAPFALWQPGSHTSFTITGNPDTPVCPGWTGYTIVNPTIQSSKSGGPLAAAWAVLHHIGDAGYMKMAKGVLD
ncbi:MAG: hypothetical protein ACI9VR_004888, partial [Cognaticolwellia sp.]